MSSNSHADLEKVPLREDFGRIVVQAFEQRGEGSDFHAIQWGASLQDYANGGVHFHMVLKLSAPRCRLVVLNVLERTFDIK